MPQAGSSAGSTLIDRNVTVETDDGSYEDVLAIQLGDVLGIITDLAELEERYGPGPGPGPEKLFKAHARYVVPWRRVVEIDRGERNVELSAEETDSTTVPDSSGRETGDTSTVDDADGTDEPDTDVGATDPSTVDDEDEDDEPDNVFDDI